MQLHIGIIVVTELILSNVNGCPSGGKETKKGNQFSPILQKVLNHSKFLFYVLNFIFRSNH